MSQIFKQRWLRILVCLIVVGWGPTLGWAQCTLAQFDAVIQTAEDFVLETEEPSGISSLGHALLQFVNALQGYRDQGADLMLLQGTVASGGAQADFLKRLKAFSSSSSAPLLKKARAELFVAMDDLRELLTQDQKDSEFFKSWTDFQDRCVALIRLQSMPHPGMMSQLRPVQPSCSNALFRQLQQQLKALHGLAQSELSQRSFLAPVAGNDRIELLQSAIEHLNVALDYDEKLALALGFFRTQGALSDVSSSLKKLAADAWMIDSDFSTLYHQYQKVCQGVDVDDAQSRKRQKIL